MTKRRIAREIRVGGIRIGGNAPVAVQSMTKTDTRDIAATVDQIRRIEDAGCDLVRVAVPDAEAADALSAIKKSVHIPVVADIHFDYRLALKSIQAGVDKIRINPGNIADSDKLRDIAAEAGRMGIPIRIGVNSGSLEKQLYLKYGGPTAEAMVESVSGQAGVFRDFGFENIVLSVKSPSVRTTIDAYRLLAVRTDLPLHLGVTEAGTKYKGTVKSCIGIGALLADGIGDTIRVSLTGDPVDEVLAGREILRALDLDRTGVELISCPGCGRCRIDIAGIASQVEDALKNMEINSRIKVAIMGCAVNGPGEASEADTGIAGGDGFALLFRKGVIVGRVEPECIVERLVEEVKSLAQDVDN